MTSLRERIATGSGEIDHPLAPEDCKVMDAMRTAMAPGRGHIERAPFDEVMEQTPDAAGVTYKTAVIGGVPGVWCRPGVALPNAVILYVHGGAYIAGTAHAYRHLAGQIAARTGVAALLPTIVWLPSVTSRRQLPTRNPSIAARLHRARNRSGLLVTPLTAVSLFRSSRSRKPKLSRAPASLHVPPRSYRRGRILRRLLQVSRTARPRIHCSLPARSLPRPGSI